MDSRRVTSLFTLAFKLLVNDRAKFIALLVGLTFSVFLMVQMISMFSGILLRASATVLNTGASIWVMDPAVTTVANAIPMPDYVLDAARSIDGVKYAVPLFSGGGLVKLSDGTRQAVNVVGLDDTSLVGRLPLVSGRIQDLYAADAFVVVRDAEYDKLESPAMGAEFEMNDRRGVVVGLAVAPVSGLFGVPTLYTTYTRAIAYVPSARYTLSYVLIEPKDASRVPEIQAAIARLGYKALTAKEFIRQITLFYVFRTGFGTNILIMTAISFLVGLSISGQTFYTFILENLERFGALKAIGARGRDLVQMILLQAFLTSMTGYGLGVGLCAVLIALAKARLPDYASVITYTNLLLAFVLVLVIAAVSTYAGIRRVLQLEPFEIFRG
ncbi:MAG TPA: ABC transporter permease [Myxococcota bacterium]|nr:ABC transporter permease [Myxococcota bacterium]